ncbi:hypothetical protein SAMN05443287_103184 [Micromonospora phaseoli]|uniref:DUF5753 domain-containing protein n=1 Tax=Micromonospora phaseoli TaxID=1144548 RepID=A0A1H6WHJ8_9ACTN|nr:hypothetical protein [Micromonospora phaseoli]PZW01816.1 hypothetical protein CLV64_102183 [Micromonospora phaseoli]GIJ78200.1 hypothetical protein Xph01_26320 [Micromonospora phaseoli]SEJ16418.1 hypothetical protein SAMN05443287_103184 [Micromonospora phaseoli]
MGFPQAFGRASAEPTTPVYLENITGARYLDKPAEVAAFEHVWHDWRRSPSVRQTQEFDQAIIEEHRG